MIIYGSELGMSIEYDPWKKVNVSTGTTCRESDTTILSYAGLKSSY